LYATLLKFGFARGIYRADPNDGLQLVDCRIANAVRCLPPENKPTPRRVHPMPAVPAGRARGDA